MEWNGDSYSTEIKIGRKCKRLDLKKDEEENYNLIYEFRTGTLLKGILLGDEITSQYAPTLVIFLIISVLISKRVFGSVTIAK